MVPLWAQATLWGLLGGGALLIGAAIGYYVKVRAKIASSIMAFGAGVLISALAFDLMSEAYGQGGFDSTALGFLAGAVVYTAANWFLKKKGAHHRKHSGNQQASEAEDSGSGLALAIGALIDGVPESIAIGISMISGSSVSVAMVAAVFLSNVPEGLSSAVGMKKANRSKGYIFGVWGGIAVISGLAAWLGYSVFSEFSPEVIAGTTALAAGAILAMVSDTMIPEAVEVTHHLTGLITVLGFLTAFVLSHV
ncbi:ZIP family metal transporter [Rufibacter quisquiliarum]|uniref:ZIP family zinc transporter n=1 Tax=Rufibacter quisquiliarum TaxID=1549639 RepID=A0A839G951_9BACT|nr:ZIP family zinc transporter [Rufibacter quisquiliarum]MBA9075512.1 ZIP family zinc transporter [Rufibacter quisquiliarum]